MDHTKNWLFIGAVIAGLSVALGAFGAHILESRISEEDLDTYQTAVSYQMYHALALVLLSAISDKFEPIQVDRIGWSFFTGILFFSGSLYLLLITDFSLLGAITPIGGVAFLTGWILLALMSSRIKQNN